MDIVSLVSAQLLVGNGWSLITTRTRLAFNLSKS